MVLISLKLEEEHDPIQKPIKPVGDSGTLLSTHLTSATFKPPSTVNTKIQEVDESPTKIPESIDCIKRTMSNTCKAEKESPNDLCDSGVPRATPQRCSCSPSEVEPKGFEGDVAHLQGFAK